MPETKRLRISPDVVTQDLGDGLVLLNIRTGVYWGLNRTGAAVWRGIENHSALDAICRQIRQEFECPGDNLPGEVNSLLSELAEHRLIIETADGGEGAPPLGGHADRRTPALNKISAHRPARAKRK